MKKTLLVLCLLFLCGGTCLAHDYFLLSDSWFLHKGDRLIFHLYVGDDFVQEEERPVQKYIAKKYSWFAGNREQDMLARYADGATPVMNEKADFQGLGLIAMERNYAHIQMTPEKFTKYLEEERLDSVLKYRASLPPKPEEREKYTRYLKSLVSCDGAGTSLYNKRLGHNLEILLLQNPYRKRTGDFLGAQVLFHGKPLPDASVEALCKDNAGRVRKTPLKTDRQGKTRFKLDCAGTWMVRMTYMIPCTTADADWESFWASYTFGVR